MVESGNQALELEKIFVFGAQLLSQCLDLIAQDPRILTRIYWKPMFEVEKAKLALFFVEGQLQFTAIENRAILISENRYQYFSLQFVFQRIPINIEEFCVTRGLTIFEHVEPPGIVRAHDAHVVWDHIENLAHTMFVQCVYEARVVFWRANLWVQMMMVDDVIAVHAARARTQVRRGVTVRDPELSKIRNQVSSLRESEAAVELQPICGKRDRARFHAFRNHAAVKAGICFQFGSCFVLVVYSKPPSAVFGSASKLRPKFATTRKQPVLTTGHCTSTASAANASKIACPGAILW